MHLPTPLLVTIATFSVLARGDDELMRSILVVGTSCSVETLLPDGNYDLESSNQCGECFKQPDLNPSLVKNCSMTHLPNITAYCKDQLEDVDKSFIEYYGGVIDCFEDFVKEVDKDGNVQRDVKGVVMGYFKQKIWEYLIGSSCLVHSRTKRGTFDFGKNKLCGDCFSTTFEDLEKFSNCTEAFLPNMTKCADILGEKGERDSFVCFNDYLDDLDVDEMARKMTKTWMGEENLWIEDYFENLKKWEFLIVSSCLVQTRLDDGSFDFKRSIECGECFEDESQFNDCTEQFLPDMVECANILEETREEAALTCFNDLLVALDVDGEARRTFEEWMNKNDSWIDDFFQNVSDSTKKWEMLLGSSCLVESRTEKGSFDHSRSIECGECFNDEDEFVNCTETFLPNMSNCLIDLNDQAIFVCFHDRLVELDADGEARKMIEEWLQNNE